MRNVHLKCQPLCGERHLIRIDLLREAEGDDGAR